MSILSILTIVVGIIGVINGIWNLVALHRGTFDYSDWIIANDSVVIIFLSLMVICNAFLI